MRTLPLWLVLALRFARIFPLFWSLSVREAMERRDPSTIDEHVHMLTVRGNAAMDDALARMADAEVPIARVVENGATIGLVSYRGALTVYLRMRPRRLLPNLSTYGRHPYHPFYPPRVYF